MPAADPAIGNRASSLLRAVLPLLWLKLEASS